MKRSRQVRSRRAFSSFVAVCVTVIASLVASSVAAGQSATNNAALLDSDELTALVEALSEADPRAESYRGAIAALARADVFAERAAEFRQVSEAASDQLVEARERLALTQPAEQVEPPGDATIAQLRALESEAAAALQAAKDQAAELAAEADRRDARRREISRLLETARQRQAALRAQLEATTATDVPLDLANAEAVLLRAQLAEMATEIDSLDAELTSYDSRRDLLPARRDLAARRIGELERRAAAWREIVQEAATREAQRAAEEAEALRRLAATQDAVMQAYAAQNAALIEQLDPAATSPLALARREIDSSASRIGSTRSSGSTPRSARGSTRRISTKRPAGSCGVSSSNSRTSMNSADGSASPDGNSKTPSTR